jgi:hypothetical protein
MNRIDPWAELAPYVVAVKAYSYPTLEDAEPVFLRVRELVMARDSEGDVDKACWRVLRNGVEPIVVVYDGAGDPIDVDWGGGEPVDLTVEEAAAFVTRHLRVLAEKGVVPGEPMEVEQLAHYGEGVPLTPDGRIG